jgi:hypothetical protein
MKPPLVFTLVIALVLLAQIPLIHTESTSAQSDSVFTLVAPDGEPLAQVSGYSLTDNQFCFTVTNISSCKKITGIGPDFAQGAIKATDVSQTGPGTFVLSADRKLSDPAGQFTVDVAFALLAELVFPPDPTSALPNGIQPGQSQRFCVQGDFRNLKAKNIAKSLLVVGAIDLGCPLTEPLSCGNVEATFTEPPCSQACINVKNNSSLNATVQFSISGLSFSGPLQIMVPAGQTRSLCGTVTSHGGSVIWQMNVTFADGSTCTIRRDVDCTGGLSETLGRREE